ncbi:Holliday junction branch migration protein RuvA [uncultured Parasphingorhabdus sp.]|uniref:Holliday junction branch migration protein RuvA n=1 Tax=uncultured Parasphingorhabdus sp. TaxID=2709694 RepID=UPI002AA7787C|nr:Holliday junction branch migration protein RuvA [uncultured Parasphingorhabdus sp.]
MIAKLTGTIDEIGTDNIVLDVQGVGYLVFCSSRTIGAIGGKGDGATIYTEMQVSETDMRLMGFASGSERDWFRLLISVQGVGGKVALAILSALEPGEISRAVATGDKAMVSRANGVGPKLALRIVNELKDKVGGIATDPVLGGGAVHAPSNNSADAVSALQNLGFKPADASAAVAAADAEVGDGATLDALVRLALKKAVR